ncbi:hypothetical protein KEM54_006077 [Ascosphaera aggregata]|nr:hypothetical protein KEM54_006077 [Ascosphaera aggregata]
MAAMDPVFPAFQTCPDTGAAYGPLVNSQNGLNGQSFSRQSVFANKSDPTEDMDVRPDNPPYPSHSHPMVGKRPPYHNGMNSILYHQNTASTSFPASYPEPGVMYNDYPPYGIPHGQPPSQPCQAEISELGPLSMNGFSHVGPEGRYAPSPTAQSEGNNELFDDDDPDDDDLINEDVAEGDPSQIRLKWKSYQEARAYRTAINSRFNPDPSIPQTDEDRQNIVKGFIVAMKHVDNDNEEQNTTRPFKASKYNDEVLEMCAWNLLEMTIQRHTTGPLRTAWHDKAKGSKPYTTFMERVDAITNAMMRVETNKCLNKKKAYVMSAGKQYLQQQLKTPGNSTPEDSNNIAANRLSSARSRAKQRTISLSGSTHTNQSQQTHPSVLGSPFSTPNNHSVKREEVYAGVGLPMRNPHPSTFDSSPNNLYSSSLPDGLLFSPSQHGGTPGSSVPRSYIDFNQEMYNNLSMNVAMSERSTPLSTSHGLQTPMTQMHGAGLGYQGITQSGGSTVSPSSLVLGGSSGGSAPRQQYVNIPIAYNHRNVSTPPQSSPRKRGFDLSGTRSGNEHPSQRRAM